MDLWFFSTRYLFSGDSHLDLTAFWDLSLSEYFWFNDLTMLGTFWGFFLYLSFEKELFCEVYTVLWAYLSKLIFWEFSEPYFLDFT